MKNIPRLHFWNEILLFSLDFGMLSRLYLFEIMQILTHISTQLNTYLILSEPVEDPVYQSQIIYYWTMVRRNRNYQDHLSTVSIAVSIPVL